MFQQTKEELEDKIIDLEEKLYDSDRMRLYLEDILKAKMEKEDKLKQENAHWLNVIHALSAYNLRLESELSLAQKKVAVLEAEIVQQGSYVSPYGRLYDKTKQELFELECNLKVLTERHKTLATENKMLYRKQNSLKIWDVWNLFMLWLFPESK